MRKRGSGVIIVIIIIFILIVIAVSLSLFLKLDKRVVCETPECFEENFNKCHPVIWDTSLSAEMKSSFEILGKEGNFCKFEQIM